MSLAASLLMSLAGRASARRFEVATRDPVASQQRKLAEILERNKDTEYGRKHGFAAIKSLPEYRAAVPITTYEDIKADMERVTRGSKNVFTAEDPVMFARTSGTTGDAKYVPVTPTCQGRDHSDQMRTWFYHAKKEHSRIFKGKMLSLVSPAVEGHTPSGIPYGSTSGHIYKNMPAVIRGTYAAPYDVFEIEEYEAKYYVLMRLGLQMPITMVASANPSSIMKMCEMADRFADDLLRDLSDGTLSRRFMLNPAIRAQVEPLCKPRPGWAKTLEAARARRDGRLLPVDYWPDLALIGCWKGGTVGNYLLRFPEWFGPDGRAFAPVRDWGYLSSEARGSIPLSDDGSGGVLTVGTNVYEFVAVDDLESDPDSPEKWLFHGVDELQDGADYYVFFTTTGGLYRYDINDVVRVVGYHHKTPVITFQRKGRGATSITGEKVTVNQIIEAFGKAGEETGLSIDHFKAEADTRQARYIFMAEAAGGIPEDRRVALLTALERHLSAINIEYAAKRKSLRLAAPRLRVMKRGWYDRQKKALIAEGKRLFQAKTVCLSTHELEEQPDVAHEVEAEVSMDP